MTEAGGGLRGSPAEMALIGPGAEAQLLETLSGGEGRPRSTESLFDAIRPVTR